jgi:hypothetical protein
MTIPVCVKRERGRRGMGLGVECAKINNKMIDPRILIAR